MDVFHALFLDSTTDEKILPSYQKTSLDHLSKGEVIIQVAYSDVNYKDALASQKSSGVIRHYPIIPGIDLSGTVLSSSDTRYKKGDNVLVTGYGLGVTHSGGYSEIARVPAEWVIPLPPSLSLKDAMIIGTAGFTAALSIDALEKKGAMSQDKQARILVTGASGGVGSMALGMLQTLGYTNVTALSRKKEQAAPFFNHLGAHHVLTLDELTPKKMRPLGTEAFDYIIDTVGGKQLEILLPQIAYDGSISLCGNAGGIAFSSTVLPHILRGVNILGIDSVNVPYKKRTQMWQRLVTDMLPTELASFIQQTIHLTDLADAYSQLLDGKMTGRYLIEIQPTLGK